MKYYLIIVLFVSCALICNAQKKVPVKTVVDAVAKTPKVRNPKLPKVPVVNTNTFNPITVQKPYTSNEKVNANNYTRSDLNKRRKTPNKFRKLDNKKEGQESCRSAIQKQNVEYKPLSSTEDQYWIQYIENEIMRVMRNLNKNTYIIFEEEKILQTRIIVLYEYDYKFLTA